MPRNQARFLQRIQQMIQKRETIVNSASARGERFAWPHRRTSVLSGRARLALIVLIWCCGAVAQAVSHCDVCGTALTNTFYSVTDRLTEEKRSVCAECIKLSARCFVCG